MLNLYYNSVGDTSVYGLYQQTPNMFFLKMGRKPFLFERVPHSIYLKLPIELWLMIERFAVIEIPKKTLEKFNNYLFKKNHFGENYFSNRISRWLSGNSFYFTYTTIQGYYDEEKSIFSVTVKSIKMEVHGVRKVFMEFLTTRSIFVDPEGFIIPINRVYHLDDAMIRKAKKIIWSNNDDEGTMRIETHIKVHKNIAMRRKWFELIFRTFPFSTDLLDVHEFERFLKGLLIKNPV